MKVRRSFLYLMPFVLALLTTPVTAQTTTQAKDKDLPNFQLVNQHLYRGAQPTIKGIAKLAAMGIKTIINLRGEGDLSRNEMEAARRAGVQYRSVPMPNLSKPSDNDVNEALSIINDQQNWPVFVHCKHGEDRTGLIIACYRISRDGWSDKEALKEAKRYGMSWVQFGMKDYIRDYYKRRTNTAPTILGRQLAKNQRQ
jgi:protein tyrosine/serine phosphatase